MKGNTKAAECCFFKSQILKWQRYFLMGVFLKSRSHELKDQDLKSFTKTQSSSFTKSNNDLFKKTSVRFKTRLSQWFSTFEHKTDYKP